MKGSNWMFLVWIAPISITLILCGVVLAFAPDPVSLIGGFLYIFGQFLGAVTIVTTPIGVWRDSKHIPNDAKWTPSRALPWIGILLGPLVGTYYVYKR